MQINENFHEPSIAEQASEHSHELNQRINQLLGYLSTRDLDETSISSTVINYEKSSQNVRARWELYKHAENYIDIEGISFQALQVPKNGVLLDIGTADGKYLHDIASIYGRSDITLIGLELMGGQIDHSPYWQAVSGGYYKSETEESIYAAQLFVGSATDMSHIADESLDAVAAMFMLYHLDTHDRAKVLAECARVLQPNGRLVVATSGINNKKLHRMHEQIIADYVSYPDFGTFSAPRLMNKDFVAELAANELQEFKTVFGYEYHDYITLNNPSVLEAYEKSLRSMYDQFNPQPPETLFNDAVLAIMDDVRYCARQGTPYRETVQRQILVCSKGQIRAKSLPTGFKRRYFGAKSEL